MSISIVDFMKIMSYVEIIDIRNRINYNNNHIPGSINIEFNELFKNPAKYLNINKRYYIYCQQGKRSVKICRFLNSIGYKVINVDGGYEAWILER